MRAEPVSQDVIDLLVTTLYNFQGAEGMPIPGAVTVLDLAGQLLWDENYRSVMIETGEHLPAPKYTWRPVAELLGSHLLDEQLLQVEQCRLFLEEVSCHHEDWTTCTARNLLSSIRDGVARRLALYPSVPSPVDTGVLEYSGMSRLPEQWTRDIGWRVNISASGCSASAKSSS